MSGVNILMFTGTSLMEFTRPIGAYRIATELRNQGYTVQVIDMFPFMVENNLKVFSTFIKKFVGTDTLWVGFSSTFFLDRSLMIKKGTKGTDTKQAFDTGGFPCKDEMTFKIKDIIKTANPKTKIVFGGAKSYLKVGKIVDIYIEGYADSTAVEMTKWLAGKNPFFTYKINPDDSISVVHDQTAGSFDFVNSSTVWHESDCIFPNEALPIEISRGCIFNCSFCSYPLNGKKKLDYIRETTNLRNEFLRNYELYGTTQYIYSDDTHNDSVDKLQILYDEVYSKLPFKVNFYTYLRLDLIAAKPDTAKLLLDSGLRACFFGIESLNYESAKCVGKGMRPEKVIETLHWLRNDVWKDEVLMGGGFIAGLPFDTRDTISAWLSQITSEDFPLDSINIYPLGMNKHSHKKVWKSDFELNYAKYGYEFPFDNRPSYWINHLTGMNFGTAVELANKAVVDGGKNRKKKIAQFGVPGFLNLGYTWEEIRGNQPDEPPLNDHVARRSALINRYYKNIVNLPTP